MRGKSQQKHKIQYRYELTGLSGRTQRTNKFNDCIPMSFHLRKKNKYPGFIAHPDKKNAYVKQINVVNIKHDNNHW